MTRELIKNLPYLADCAGAKEVSERNLYLFDISANEGTPFDKCQADMDNPGLRLSAIDITNIAKNKAVAIAGMARLIMKEFTSYYKKNYITKEKWENVVNKYKQIAITDNVEHNNKIDEYLTVDQAVNVNSFWLE